MHSQNLLITLLVIHTFAHATDAAEPPASAPASQSSIKTWPTLTDDRNAALPVLDVARSIGARWDGAPRVTAIDQVTQWSMPLTPQLREQMGAQRTYWARELSLLDEMDGRDGFDWGNPPPTPIIIAGPDIRASVSLGLIRELCLCDAAMALDNGEIATAWRRARQLARLADAVGTWPQDLYVARSKSMDETACRIFNVAATHSGFGAFVHSHRMHVTDELHRLADPSVPMKRYLRWLRIEQSAFADSGAALAAGWKPDARRLDSATLAGKLAGEGALPPALTVYDALFARWIAAHEAMPELSLATHPHPKDLLATARGASAAFATAYMLPYVTDIRMSHTKLAAVRSLTAVTVACALYRIDRAGALPEKIEDLTPEYLPTVPTDPLDRNPHPLRYRDGEQASVWSTGPGGNVKGGSAPPLGAAPPRQDAPEWSVQLNKAWDK